MSETAGNLPEIALMSPHSEEDCEQPKKQSFRKAV